MAWYNRGLMKSHEGRYEEALADIQEAATQEPDDQKIAEFRTQLMNRVQRDKHR